MEITKPYFVIETSIDPTTSLLYWFILCVIIVCPIIFRADTEDDNYKHKDSFKN
jgi:hypothetical protein